MATLTVKLHVAWWLKPYFYMLALICAFTAGSRTTSACSIGLARPSRSSAAQPGADSGASPLRSFRPQLGFGMSVADEIVWLRFVMRIWIEQAVIERAAR